MFKSDSFPSNVNKRSEVVHRNLYKPLLKLHLKFKETGEFGSKTPEDVREKISSFPIGESISSAIGFIELLRTLSKTDYVFGRLYKASKVDNIISAVEPFIWFEVLMYKGLRKAA